METKDDKTVISNHEFIELLQAAKYKDPDAMLKLIELYKADILRVSKYIRLPLEDAVSTVILEFLELVQSQENEDCKTRFRMKPEQTTGMASYFEYRCSPGFC